MMFGVKILYLDYDVKNFRNNVLRHLLEALEFQKVSLVKTSINTRIHSSATRELAQETSFQSGKFVTRFSPMLPYIKRT